MTCREWRIQISSDLDGALSERERREVRLHLDDCESCRGFLRQQQRLTSWLASDEFQLEPPQRLWAEIEARIAPAPGRVLRPPQWIAARPRAGLAAAACLLLAIISGSLFWNSGRIDAEAQRDIAAYEMMPQVPENPFFESLAVEGNPFDDTRSPQ